MCFLLCFLRFFLFGFYSLADSGERRKPRRTGHSGVRGGRDKGFALKLSWPSTAEYRMMKLKKLKKIKQIESSSVIRTRQVLGRQGAMCTLVGLMSLGASDHG